MLTLDLILPCYNPAKGWVKTVIHSISEINETLPDLTLYVCLVNDGSTKGIEEEDILELRNAIPAFNYVVYKVNQGKGFAVRSGVRLAQHDFCVYTDIDFPFSKESFADLYSKLKDENVDVAVGVRDEDNYKEISAGKKWTSKGFRWLIKLIFALPVYDTQASLTGFNRKGREVFLRTKINGYLFNLEFLRLCANKEEIIVNPVTIRKKAKTRF